MCLCHYNSASSMSISCSSVFTVNERNAVETWKVTLLTSTTSVAANARRRRSQLLNDPDWISALKGQKHAQLLPVKSSSIYVSVSRSAFSFARGSSLQTHWFLLGIPFKTPHQDTSYCKFLDETPDHHNSWPHLMLYWGFGAAGWVYVRYKSNQKNGDSGRTSPNCSKQQVSTLHASLALWIQALSKCN